MSNDQVSGSENEALKLLIESQHALVLALNSLGGKASPTPAGEYLVWSASLVNNAAAGYLCLRTQGVIQASKLLVRPILEATFNGAASVKDKAFLFRKGFSEWEEDNKLYMTEKSERDEILTDLEQQFRLHLPDYPIKHTKMTAFDAATMAGLPQVYASYRAYCQFTHGALRATTGGLNDATNSADTRMVLLSVAKMLELLRDYTHVSVQSLPQVVQTVIRFFEEHPTP